MTHITYLSLGSNLGDRLGNLKTAIAKLSPRVRPLLHSSIYETEPWGYTDQPAFLNMVTKASTGLEPMALLAFLKRIETSMGRKETFRFGPRLIDLDILFYDDLILDIPDLTIPHARITERAFVLVPLADVAPDFVHPVLGTTVSQLKSNLDDSRIKLYQSTLS
ncbi:MAG: 2-amino-4-hydroxy-6-hydroxymethyldihydropteridine diphosphokinase [Chloroflexi bacterium RBG_16_54_11]|nr:MAG: 2-amino-4-hydroxy-6-hydroxymethyldihydropteridine diphosphokinase [Chloroflexi bacterium RBG_16_54_11]